MTLTDNNAFPPTCPGCGHITGLCICMPPALIPGDRVEAGEPGTDDHDTGRILSIDGDMAEVGWSSGVKTSIALADLRPTHLRPTQALERLLEAQGNADTQEEHDALEVRIIAARRALEHAVRKYEIQTLDHGMWTSDLGEDVNEFASEAEALEGIEELKKLGDDWASAEYRVMPKGERR